MPVFRAEAGSRPACDSLSFASPKESEQRKGDPQSATPSRCEGADLRRGGCGVRRGTRFAAAQRRSNSRGELDNEARALRRACHPATAPAQAQPEGGGSRTAEQPHGSSLRSTRRGPRPPAPAVAPSARRLRQRDWAERSNGPKGCPLPIPSVCAEERRVWRIRARDCLSEASSSETPPNPSTAGCPKRSAGTQTVGSPFLW